MSKEHKFKTIIWAAALCLIFASLFFSFNSHDFYAFLFVAAFAALISFAFEAYLRVQHNIDASINSTRNAIEGIKEAIEQSSATIVGEFGAKTDKIVDEIAKIKSSLDDDSKKYGEFREEMVDFFENLLIYLEENKQEISLTGDKINAKFGELEDIQSKTITLLRQSTDFQRDQAIFLEKELEEIKAGQRGARPV